MVDVLRDCQISCNQVSKRMIPYEVGHDLVDAHHEPKNLPVPFRPCAEPDDFSWMGFKTSLGDQWKTLVQVEALATHALFQHAFHPLRPGNLDFEFGQFLLSQ